MLTGVEKSITAREQGCRENVEKIKMSRKNGSCSRQRKIVIDDPDPFFSWTTPINPVNISDQEIIIRFRREITSLHLTAHLPYLPLARSEPFSLISLSSELPPDIVTPSNEAQTETNYSETTTIRETQENHGRNTRKMEMSAEAETDTCSKNWRQFSYLRSFFVEFPPKLLIFRSSALRLIHNSFIAMFYTLSFPKLIHFWVKFSKYLINFGMEAHVHFD